VLLFVRALPVCRLRGSRVSWICGLVLAGFIGASFAAQDLDALEIARRMAASGAADLALERIDVGQPQDMSAPLWADWELLRLNVLYARDRHAEVLKRTAGPIRNVALPDAVATAIWSVAARAAIRTGQAGEARANLARALLRADLKSNDYRQLRLLVIETYLADRNGDDAYRSMLRYQQDFTPLNRDEVARFVSGLLGIDRSSDAAQWLTQLDPGSPYASLLRLRAGLITADAAIKQARAILAKGADEAAWGLLMAAGRTQMNRAIEIEVHEAQLNATNRAERRVIDRRTSALWSLYESAGRQAANQMQLLSGEDTQWMQHAGRLAVSQPQIARALYATLISSARSADAREFAQLQLVGSLRDQKLPDAALHLFSDQERFQLNAMGARARLQLGSLAAEQRVAAAAVRYWQNLPIPEGLSSTEWRIRNVAVLFQAGMVDTGMATAKGLFEGNNALSQEQLRRLIGVASDAIDVWHVRAGEWLLTLCLPFASGPDRVQVLLGLGKARELTGEFRLAADAYLQVATAAVNADADRDALRMRELAALNLAKAGMREDARSIYQWLANVSKDPAVRDNAVRALRNL
jgi:hypothetical protein